MADVPRKDEDEGNEASCSCSSDFGISGLVGALAFVLGIAGTFYGCQMGNTVKIKNDALEGCLHATGAPTPVCDLILKQATK